MTAIFISHATADASLASAFVDFLKEAIGVPEKEIFCSSVEGHGIPFCSNFNDYMKDKIQDPDLVILLITESYLERHFCLMELGATWAKSHLTCPIVVGDVSFETITNTLGLVQAWKVEDHKKLNSFRKLIAEETSIDLEERGDDVWDEKRRSWRRRLNKIVAQLPKATTASRKELDEANDEISDLNSIIDDLERELSQANQQITELKNCKDAKEVKKITEKYISNDSKETFEKLISQLNSSLPTQFGREVCVHIFLEYSGKSVGQYWFQNASEELSNAINYDWLSEDPGHAPQWGTKKLEKVEAAFKALEKYLVSPDHSDFVEAKETEDTSMCLSDLEFFDHHINL
ncbi:TIR domain-containing protein [Pseudovibrio denitrificans]|uniref:toll/interleukin-1 receptor domain-containing protein n=1 Tax=Pseudovibrio denitrificans TaxID=258256 RepID=UPI0039BEEA7E